MSEIPEDIYEAAKAVTGGWMAVGFPEENKGLVDAVARAILAERAACANAAEDATIILPEWCPIDPKFTYPAIDQAMIQIASAIRNPLPTEKSK